jgi:hypothetical protein
MQAQIDGRCTLCFAALHSSQKYFFRIAKKLRVTWRILARLPGIVIRECVKITLGSSS